MEGLSRIYNTTKNTLKRTPPMDRNIVSFLNTMAVSNVHYFYGQGGVLLPGAMYKQQTIADILIVTASFVTTGRVSGK